MVGSFYHKALRGSLLSGGWPNFGDSLARREILTSSSIGKTILHETGVCGDLESSSKCARIETLHNWHFMRLHTRLSEAFGVNEDLHHPRVAVRHLGAWIWKVNPG